MSLIFLLLFSSPSLTIGFLSPDDDCCSDILTSPLSSSMCLSCGISECSPSSSCEYVNNVLAHLSCCLSPASSSLFPGLGATGLRLDLFDRKNTSADGMFTNSP